MTCRLCHAPLQIMQRIIVLRKIFRGVSRRSRPDGETGMQVLPPSHPPERKAVFERLAKKDGGCSAIEHPPDQRRLQPARANRGQPSGRFSSE
ncbi:hypothetical protein D779_4096 [Imhoffiella purpurea]|uniref:Uncharacterized protein n=1 Tax=Imhoffiella purpurea TaxID=1249627 RepID=W9VA98_9GAMM|nr:hypothetical protein D779_4096 [Imhoffiella purpurea]